MSEPKEPTSNNRAPLLRVCVHPVHSLPKQRARTIVYGSSDFSTTPVDFQLRTVENTNPDASSSIRARCLSHQVTSDWCS